MNTLQDAKQLQQTTKDFAIRIIKAFIRLPKEESIRIIGRQFVRSGTSVAANYRACCRARSHADFVSKISVVAEEADETLLWLELLVESQLIGRQIAEPLMSECEQLVRIFSASLATAKRNR
ncbi:MAG TPA: four helix bundle protein [Chthoniobacterales bacterium]